MARKKVNAELEKNNLILLFWSLNNPVFVVRNPLNYREPVDLQMPKSSFSNWHKSEKGTLPWEVVHRNAVFSLKMLQMSWVCNQGRYELLAYDLIGLQYYYLGDLERAKQFHNKMAEGRIEGQNSDLRKSGINKILLILCILALP